MIDLDNFRAMLAAIPKLDAEAARTLARQLEREIREAERVTTRETRRHRRGRNRRPRPDVLP